MLTDILESGWTCWYLIVVLLVALMFGSPQLRCFFIFFLVFLCAAYTLGQKKSYYHSFNFFFVRFRFLFLFYHSFRFTPLCFPLLLIFIFYSLLLTFFFFSPFSLLTSSHPPFFFPLVYHLLSHSSHFLFLLISSVILFVPIHQLFLIVFSPCLWRHIGVWFVSVKSERLLGLGECW